MVAANLLLAVGLPPLVLLTRPTGSGWSTSCSSGSPWSRCSSPRPSRRCSPAGRRTGTSWSPANALNGQAGQVARLVGGRRSAGVAAAVGGHHRGALLDARHFVVATLLRADPHDGRGSARRGGTGPTSSTSDATLDQRGHDRLDAAGGARRWPARHGVVRGAARGVGHPAVRVLLVFGCITAPARGSWARCSRRTSATCCTAAAVRPRRDHQRPGGRRDRRRDCRGRQPGRPVLPRLMLGAGAVVFGAGRPGDLPLPVAAGLGLAGGRRDGAGRLARGAGHRPG